MSKVKDQAWYKALFDVIFLFALVAEISFVAGFFLFYGALIASKLFL